MSDEFEAVPKKKKPLNERLDKLSDILKKRIKPPPKEKFTWVVFEKSVMNMYLYKKDAIRLKKQFDKKNVNPDVSYVVEKIEFKSKKKNKVAPCYKH